MERHMYTHYVLRAAVIAGDVANYCDHVEHNEDADRQIIRDAGCALRELACEIAANEGVDLKVAYANRLRMIESANVLFAETPYDGGADAEAAVTWRDLQLVQARHDRAFHPDVVGMHKGEQLRHYTLHLAKIVAALSRRAESSSVEREILERRLPDLLLFGIKLSTVTGECLSSDALRSGGMPRSEQVNSTAPALAA